MPETMENIPYSNYHRNGLRKKSERTLGMGKNNSKWTISLLNFFFFGMSLGSIFQSKRNVSQGEAGKSNAVIQHSFVNSGGICSQIVF